MSVLSVQPTFPIFTEADGQPLENGYIWIGTANLDPQVNPIAVYWDAALTQPAAQPIRTINGYPAKSGSPGRLYVNSDYSIRVQNKNGSAIYSAPASTDKYSSELITFLQAGTGAVTTTVQAKLRETVSVKDFGAVGDGVTNDTAAIQNAINSLPVNGGAVYFPAGTYLTDSLTGVTGLDFYGNGSDYYGGSVIKLKTSNTTLITFTDKPQFKVRNILFYGTSNTTEKGEDVSDVGVYFNNTSAGDIDASFQNVGFLFFRDCVKIVGRNVKFNNCSFSNSKRGVYIPAAQPADVRGLEMYGTRFHSMGKTGATSIGSVYVEAASNFQEIVVSGFDCDDCAVLFYGFAGMTQISGGLINKARDYGVVVDSTGNGTSAERRVFSVSNVSYWQANATTVLGGLISSTGTLQMILSGLSVAGCGGHGISVNNDYAWITGCQVENVGQVTNNTYDAFISTSNFTKFKNCQALQSRTSAPTNKGRYGFNVPNPIGIEIDNFADVSFATGPIKGLSNVAIAAASGTKAYTATLSGSSGVSLLEIDISGQMGGTYTKSIGTRIVCSFGLTSNLIQDVTISKTDFGDATGANISLAITAVGSGNQVLFTFTNADATNAFLGNIRVVELSYYGSSIQSFA